MKYATTKKYWDAIKKKSKKYTSSQPRKLIFGIQPYLTQLDEMSKNNTNWGAIQKMKKMGDHKKKHKKFGVP
jgi:hypothetical protein